MKIQFDGQLECQNDTIQAIVNIFNSHYNKLI